MKRLSLEFNTVVENSFVFLLHSCHQDWYPYSMHGIVDSAVIKDSHDAQMIKNNDFYI